eukprot:5143668-Amphidinium_carterae.2
MSRDSGAAVSAAPLAFAPHVPLQPIRGDQKLQSRVTPSPPCEVSGVLEVEHLADVSDESTDL